MDQNPAQRLTAREALKRVLVSRYENPDVNLTVLAAYSVPKGYMVLANASGNDLPGFELWFFSHSAVLFERLKLPLSYTTEESMVLAAKRLANILEAVPLSLD
jgi:hypothetical protein